MTNFEAITSRTLEKDYLDLYFILQSQSLIDALDNAAQKIPALDKSVILKALVYYDDIVPEPILFKSGFAVEFSKVQDFLRDQVRTFFVTPKQVNP